MELVAKLAGKTFTIDSSKGIDLSIPLINQSNKVNCFWAPLFEISPVKTDQFIGSIAEGGLVNFKNIRINPHGNGTHTECIGHISKEVHHINDVLQSFHFPASLITIIPEIQSNGDRVITPNSIQDVLTSCPDFPALIIRTIPNHTDKLQRVYSGTNPCYVSQEAMQLIVDKGIEHLLIDIPSLDREEDGGHLLAHNTFWNYFGNIDQARTNCTVTELIYVPDEVKDGSYLLNLQIISLEMDASPSKPIIYPLD